MSFHPANRARSYTHWKVKAKFRLDALLAVPEDKRSAQERVRIVELRRRLVTNRDPDTSEQFLKSKRNSS